MKATALLGLRLLFFCHGVSSVIHTLKYFYTASSGVSTFPEFVVVGLVDEVQMVHYDSNSQRVVPKQAWMEQVTRDDPNYLELTGNFLGAQQSFQVNIDNLKKRFNHSGGAHIQWMGGCEWDDEDGTTNGYSQYGYDGEDFIVLDLKSLTWIVPIRQAFPTKLKLDPNRVYNEYSKNYQTKECVHWLKNHLANLQRTERLPVSLPQRSPSFPLVCDGPGIYPDRVLVFWRRDGQELHEQLMDMGELRPNHDGTFRVSVDLNLASAPREDWRRYECVVQPKGVEDLPTPLDPALIRTKWGLYRCVHVQSNCTQLKLLETLMGEIIGSVVGVLILAVVGVFLYKKRSGSDNSSENTEELNRPLEAQPQTTKGEDES
ncbi:unnamed protein product [Lota lota]